MNDVQELVGAVQAAGATIRADGAELKIKPPGVVPSHLKARLKAHKAELLRHLEHEAGKRPMEASPMEASPMEAILRALLAFGVWKTTTQIAKAVNLPTSDALPILEALLQAGSVERDGGPIYIWKAVTVTTIQARLKDAGISIAIDRATGSALLLFKPTDADIVKHTADVYQLFDVKLTPTQVAELTADLDYFKSRQAKKIVDLENFKSKLQK